MMYVAYSRVQKTKSVLFFRASIGCHGSRKTSEAHLDHDVFLFSLNNSLGNGSHSAQQSVAVIFCIVPCLTNSRCLRVVYRYRDHLSATTPVPMYAIEQVGGLQKASFASKTEGNRSDDTLRVFLDSSQAAARKQQPTRFTENNVQRSFILMTTILTLPKPSLILM
eukprot:scaffold6949_cov86-Skeletonema_dohrnii-CCMP3373.AAC.1